MKTISTIMRVICCVTMSMGLASATPVIETFDDYAGGTSLSTIGGGGVWWTDGAHAVVAGGGVAGSNGIGTESSSSFILNWQGQPFQWSAMGVNDSVTIGLDFQSSPAGMFDDDRVGWTVDVASNASSGNQFALQLDTAEGGMVCYWDSNRTVLNALAGIKASTWYRFHVRFTKLGDTRAAITGTLTELDASGQPTGTPYVGTIADSSLAPYSAPASRFTSSYQYPSFKNYVKLEGNADNAYFHYEPARPDYVVIISVDGMGSYYVTPFLEEGLNNELVNIKRIMTEGAGTLNARCDHNYAITLPNHITMMTSRGVSGTDGHGWTDNGNVTPTQTLHDKGKYIDSGFAVAHDAGLRTGIWSGKSKFILFQQSYSATTGAADTNGVDNGNNKIDVNLINNGISATDITINFTNEMTTAPCHYSLLHYQDPDATGHSSSWSTNPASAFATTLKQVDNAIGVVLDMIGNSPVLNGRTAIILTADHGGHDKTHGDMSEPLDYTIPFYIWGPGVTAGADLYSLNPTTRRSPGTSENTPYTGPQPIRNGDAANTALDLLGLYAIPGSSINAAQDLAYSGVAALLPPEVSITSPADGATLASPVTINATAGDADGTVTNVSFYAGTTLLGDDATSPYSIVWSDAPDGSHALTAVAYDNDGLCTTSSVVSITIAAPSSDGFTAYNDCSLSSATTPDNTTKYSGNGTTSGFLKDFDTGTVLPVTLTITAYNVTYNGTGGPMCAKGTDAYNVFNGKVVFDNAIWYTSETSGWWMDATFSGLDPAKEYEFVTSVNRDGGSGYNQRMSKFTISGADFCVQASTPGVTIHSNESVTFCSGNNTDTGYVARWTNIKCGADGIFKVRVEDGGTTVKKGYAFDGIMLRETPGAPMPPQVAITAPEEGSVLPRNFAIEAAAADDGTITNLAFYANDELLGWDAGAPYSWDWVNAPVGTNVLYAVAWDDDGLCTTSTPVTVTVVAPQPPTVAIISPANNATVGTTFMIEAEAADVAGTVTNVEFRADGVLLGSDTAAPYSFTWSGAPVGACELTAVAWDNDGMCSTSTPVQITITYMPPTVSISSPGNGTTVGTTFTVTANASDADGTVAKVDFCLDDAIYGTDDTQSPFSMVMQGVSPGAHSVKAVAWDSTGLCSTSAVVNVTAVVKPPSIAITSPTNNTTVASIGLGIQTTASDPDGQVASVAFYGDGNLLATDTAAPFNHGWASPGAGSHEVFAVARDNDGYVATSAVVTVTVSADIGFTAYNDCSPGDPTPANTTQFEPEAAKTGILRDFDSGLATPVTITLAAANVSYRTKRENAAIATGTDCYNVFNGKVPFNNCLAYKSGAGPWWATVTFTGLDPAKEYEFVTSCDRANNTKDYPGRHTKFTISGVDSCVEASTPGVIVTNANMSVIFDTGYNTVNGYVARWRKIRCGEDGSFTVKAEDGAGPTPNKSYGFDGIMLRETSAPATPARVAGIAISNNTIQMTWSNSTGRVRIEATPSLTNPEWTTVPGATNLGTTSHTIPIDAAYPRRFFRIVTE